MTRVTDMSTHQIRMANLLATQERLFDTQLQVATGKKSQRYSGISQDAVRLIGLETVHARTAQFIKNIGLVDQRMQQMETAATTVMDVATDFRTLLVNALNIDNANDLEVVQDAQNFLETVVGQLNVQSEGRYLFAGTRTDTAPVDISDPNYFNPPPTIPTPVDTNYFQGDTTKLRLQADTTLNISYGVTADESGFEKALRALNFIATRPGTPTASELDEALRVINESLDELPTIISGIGSVRNQLASIKNMHEDAQIYTEGTIADIEEVDVTETITRLNQDQLTLEATFMVISSLQNLTLTRFL